MQADTLIQQYKKEGHPLGEELRLDETDALILLLRARLKASEAELNLAPFSLKRLEVKLTEYHQHSQATGQELTDDDTVQFIRELAAYIGVVLLKHTEAIWRGGGSLWGTEIEITGPIRGIDGSRRFTANSLVANLGNQAASAWDAIVEGRPTRLYSSYLDKRKKIAKQRLSKRDF